MVFFLFFPYFKVFINIHEYKNKIIYISGHGMKDLYLPFNLVQGLVVYDK